MAREIYNLSDATKATITDKVKKMAAATGKSEAYFYKILQGNIADPFPPLLKLYVGALKAGESTCHYDNEFEFAKVRYAKPKPTKEATECFKEKLRVQNSTISKFIESLADGELDLKEIAELEICIDQERQNLLLIETMLNFRKSVLTKD